MKVYFCSVCKGYHTVDYCLVQQKSDELFDLVNDEDAKREL